jgi:ankyrin repeat protein
VLGQNVRLSHAFEGSTWIQAVKLAAKHGHAPIVEMLLNTRRQLDLPKDIVVVPDVLDYLLWLAASEGHEGLVRLLLKQGANPTSIIAPLDLEYTYPQLSIKPLLVAVTNGQLPVMDIMLCCRHMSTSPASRSILEDLLLQAAIKGQSDIVRYLLKKGVKPNVRDSNGIHLMSYAAIRCSEAAIRCLLDHGADAHPAPGERSLLKLSLQHGKIPAVKLLLDKIIENKYIPNSHSMPEFLCAAAASGLTDLVEKLLRNGADPNAAVEDCRALNSFKPEPDCSALRWAVGYNHQSMVKLLLNHGAKPTPQTLVEAIQNKSVSIIRLLLDAGLDPNEYHENSPPPLHVAVKDNALFRLLLDRGADLDMQGRFHASAMLEALQSGQVSQVQILLDRGQQLELQEEHASLLDSATWGGVRMLELLFSAGFQVTPGGSDSESVLSAIQKQDRQVLEFLLRMNVGLPPSQTLATAVNGMFEDLWSQPPYFHGTSASTKDILDLLLRHGFDINSKTNETGKTCLWSAIQRQDPFVLRLLLDRGAEPMLHDNEDEMPFFSAVVQNFAEGVRILIEWLDLHNHVTFARSQLVTLLFKAIWHAQSQRSWKIVRSLERFVYSHGLHFEVFFKVEKLASEKA